jgi:CRP-like cAMP-binding protein
VRREFAPRQMIVRPGEAADAVLLLVRGEVSVLIDTAGGRMHRLATLSAGMAFGEPALQAHATTRTAFVRADTSCVCWMLGRDTIERLRSGDPAVLVRLLQNALGVAARVLARSVDAER